MLFNKSYGELKEEPMTIDTFARKDPITIHPLKEEIVKAITDLNGVIVVAHDGLGFRYRILFTDTNYGASVIKAKGSYGHEKDLFELAVLYNGHPCYDTEVTNDVVSNLTDGDVLTIIRVVKRLDENGRIRR